MKIEVDIELDGKVIHTSEIDIDLSDSLFGNNYLDGLTVRSHVDRQVTCKIKTQWRYTEPCTDQDKEFVAMLERSGMTDTVPKTRKPKPRE